MGLFSSKNKMAFHTERAKSLFSVAGSSWESTLLDLSTSGAGLSGESMLKASATWSAIRAISEAVGTMPLHVYRRTDKGREKAKDHDLYKLLHRQPNRFTTPIEFKEAIAVSLCVWGQAYIKTERLGNRPIGLQVVPKNKVTVKLVDGEPVYALGDKKYQYGDIVPIKGYGQAGSLEGYPIWKYADPSNAIAIAAENYGAKFFNSGGRLKGAVSHDQVLTEDQKDKLRKSLDYIIKNKDGLAILDGGLNYQSFGGTNNEAQFIETRKFQIAETARIFRVPLSKLMEMDRATYANSEQENISFVQDCLMPYLTRIEQTFNNTLLTSAEQKEYYCEFDTKALMRGDQKSRSEYYYKMRLAGALTINEIRASENLNNVEGGDDIHVPLNMAPIDQLREILGEDNANENDTA